MPYAAQRALSERLVDLGKPTSSKHLRRGRRMRLGGDVTSRVEQDLDPCRSLLKFVSW